jgi:hypothetical protein
MDNCANSHVLLGGQSNLGIPVVAIVLDFKTITVADQTRFSAESASHGCVGILLDILCG